MKPRTKHLLTIVGAEAVAAVLFSGVILCALGKLEAGHLLVTNRYNFNVPVAGSLAIFGVLGAIVLILLPRSMWRRMNMSDAERKKRQRQDRMTTPSHQQSDIPWH